MLSSWKTKKKKVHCSEREATLLKLFNMDSVVNGFSADRPLSLHSSSLPRHCIKLIAPYSTLWISVIQSLLLFCSLIPPSIALLARGRCRISPPHVLSRRYSAVFSGLLVHNNSVINWKIKSSQTEETREGFCFSNTLNVCIVFWVFLNSNLH